jgi:hypothetical protein
MKECTSITIARSSPPVEVHCNAGPEPLGVAVPATRVVTRLELPLAATVLTTVSVTG